MPVGDRQRRRVMRWVAAAAIAVVASGIVVAGAMLSAEPSLDELLDRRVVAALERSTPGSAPSAHAHNAPKKPNHRTDIDGFELVCAAKVFGHEPADVSTVEDVRVVYAHRTCAAVGPGLMWPESIRETGPVAVKLGVPDTLVLPENALPGDANAQYADRIRAVIPKRYQSAALAYPDFVDPDVADDLQDLIDD
jgi:hypothetical protein